MDDKRSAMNIAIDITMSNDNAIITAGNRHHHCYEEDKANMDDDRNINDLPRKRPREAFPRTGPT